MPADSQPPPHDRGCEKRDVKARRAPHLRLVGADEQPAPTAVDGRRWSMFAIGLLEAEHRGSAETPLIRIPAPEFPGIHLMLKDESAHPTGSLKHRLARALFLEAIAGGMIGPGTAIVEASSGSTAIAEAWFARRLGLPFTAVVPASTAPRKIAAIGALGGTVEVAPPGFDLETHARTFARKRGAYFMNQFERAADAIDWKGDTNIAAALLSQLRSLGLGAPAWIVTGAGTGGTAATIGRHIRLRQQTAATRLCVVDPEGSAYFRSFASVGEETSGTSSAVTEGIGRGRIGRAFLPGVIDHMIAVSNEGSVSGAHWLQARTARAFGPSTGTNIIGALMLAQAMRRRGETGTIALIGNDDGDRYADTVFDPAWCRKEALTCGGWRALLEMLGEPSFPAAY